MNTEQPPLNAGAYLQVIPSSLVQSEKLPGNNHFLNIGCPLQIFHTPGVGGQLINQIVSKIPSAAHQYLCPGGHIHNHLGGE